ncbi:ER protein Pkr1-domain-containing protein [Lipomyces tetrasporus]|uniref:ER protein Pkr1-domain-containing protein n=1 Tax=Lipomyces tetrasporus TaxID=54092 RepID=A0AAD7VWH6_9ASCO|nr:ER protein Pkr1-domain-containing protein [Lipomyces tetrasporus]KAJ8104171.1 ER protein Pkr1-domain-containing protein [Lipomyces tetrasporus]
MSQFFQDLWDSIFTPGTTPTLVRATHYSFAALLVTLVVLCIATYNKHFFILTAIAGCLWGTLTWFIGELDKMKEEMAKQNAPITEDITDKVISGEEATEEPKTEEQKKDE